jgi:hypothetical protein
MWGLDTNGSFIAKKKYVARQDEEDEEESMRGSCVNFWHSLTNPSSNKPVVADLVKSELQELTQSYQEEKIRFQYEFLTE